MRDELPDSDHLDPVSVPQVEVAQGFPDKPHLGMDYALLIACRFHSLHRAVTPVDGFRP